MAYQGLFTQGPTVDDLLQKRNKRQQDMQQQLMNDAAQGARDPQRARMGSMFGSIIGRALGNNAGGADTELQQAEQRETTEAGLVSQYAKAASGTDVAAMYASANAMINYGDPKSINMGSILLQRADQLKAGQQATETARQEKAEEALKLSMEEDSNYKLAEAIRENDPVLADRVEAGDAQSITIALSSLKKKEEDISSLAIKVKDAFGFEVGSNENMAQMQILMAKESNGQDITITLNDKGQQVMPLTKPVKALLQKGVLTSFENIVKLDDIANNFDPSYFTYAGAAKSATGAVLDKVGLSSELDITGTVDFNSKRVIAISQIDMLFNQYRKEITGAAAAVQELERLEKSYLNSKRGPEATKAMLNELKRIGRRGYETKKRTLREGLAVGDTLIFHDDPKQEASAIDWNDPTTYTQAQLDAAFAAAPIKKVR